MNQDLKSQLEKESDEELFLFFKSEGAIDFEKKIIAGILLQQRKYDKKVLQGEKDNILETYQKQIQENNNTDQIIAKKKKEVRNSALFALAILTITVMVQWQNSNGMTLQNQPPIYVYILLSILFVSLFVYRALSYQNKVAKKIEEEKENTEILQKRLQIIEQEWDF